MQPQKKPSRTEMYLFEKSREKWGLRAQILKTAEEAGELSVACLHMENQVRDLSKSREEFAEEVADLEFMLAEMRHYFPWLDEAVKTYRKQKREYLKELLEK